SRVSSARTTTSARHRSAVSVSCPWCGGNEHARRQAGGRVRVHARVGFRAGTPLIVRIFEPLYQRVLAWSRHPHAERYLGMLSFAESSFFPIPPDVMLAPMCLAERRKAWRFATLTTLASVVGGIAGYLIG